MDELEIITLFCKIDDFCQLFESEWKRILLKRHAESGRWWTTRESSMTLSEVMTIAILFHSSGYRTFKHYYQYLVDAHLHPFFPTLVSYKHFNKLMKRLIFPFFIFQKSLQGKSEGIAFVDSTVLTVRHIVKAFFKRIDTFFHLFSQISPNLHYSLTI